MGDVILQRDLYTADEFERIATLPENHDRLLELIYGEIVEKVPTEVHGAIVALIVTFLVNYIKPRQLGRVSVEVKHRMPNDNYNARIPDVTFRLGDKPAVERGAVPEMPDLGVEVQSPDDRPNEMRSKAMYYLQNGSRLVWLVYPKPQKVEVCTLDADGNLSIQAIEKDGTLDGGDVLPGFTLAVKEIFEI